MHWFEPSSADSKEAYTAKAAVCVHPETPPSRLPTKAYLLACCPGIRSGVTLGWLPDAFKRKWPLSDPDKPHSFPNKQNQNSELR